MNAPTERPAWIARCVWRLQRQYYSSVQLPGGDRGLTWSECQRLISHVLAEHKEE